MRHERCPKCAEKGQDTRGDNLAIYPDGSEHCFSCRYHKHGDKVSVRNYDNPMTVTVRPTGTRNLDEWPPANKVWLRQFLTDSEIKGNFEYVPSMQRHLFLVDQKEDGWFWDGRSMYANTPKNVQAGPKPFYPIWCSSDESQTLVIVEDIVSALKISRVYNTLPLFGSYCRPSWVAKILADKYYKRIIIWLDNDKTSEALELSRKLSISRPTYVVNTEMDPKWYSDLEIKDLVDQTYLTLLLTAH